MIVTPSFLPGALVTLSSFAQHHPEHDLKVHVLQRDMNDQHRKHLEKLPFSFQFWDHDPEIARRAETLPIFPERRNRLLILQAFQIPGTLPLLVLDADLLIQGSMESLMKHEGAIVGSGESLHLRGGWRDGTTLTPGEGPPPPGALTATINTGVFRLSPELRGGKHYQDLLERLEPEWWKGLGTDLTDQALLNHHFKDTIKVVHSGYNYVLQYRDIFEKDSGMTPEECPVLHFAGPAKPWIPHSILQNLRDYTEPNRRWMAEWLKVLDTLNSG